MSEVIQNLAPALAEHQFFKAFRPDQIETLAGCAENVVFQPDEYVFRQGQDAERLYVIKRGRVSLELSAAGKGTIVLATAGKDDVVGWSWLVAPHRWRYSGKAAEVIRAIALDGACLRKKCDEDTELGYQFHREVVKILAHRLEAARIQLLDIYGDS